ncbi:phosphocholine cytidylyltransferase family protein [Arthrobacter sp. zg-Y820]|uniref:phosphocholine cytidylyltransferase family protein n=1 Tax=unclassified Arthrobacter TaxID=235627 RepID=UPI001E59EA7E|nr:MULTISPECIES: phosphocholine cytidylyltransferase family protein [unclassified Arthrobacter]MCC9196206.1 phosphocholine cytidylyltransferase family protein [Arthrobacter sp. zg-Y820]MDK1279066.1 phosphocholine cytidylyltransferase family protein [Arthrobacter sp. zg.Y820]MDK1359318.1 phosphocholine cytidylyltransferase family protein [Arthrobacter sp. zg-Y1219]WIB11164.1 phosphocholine cytidylyltransferase family protein [Arthrobacter sp. zg-Y820]
MTLQTVILAAGMGTRLARPHPKPLTPLDDGRTIMTQQVDNLKAAFGEELRLTIVVGYKLEQIMEHMPDASFVYNEAFDQTNTSKSLLKALKNSHDGGVLWMNGDVVFDPEMLEYLRDSIKADKSFIAVDTSSVSDEEVKYTVGEDGFINNLSKKTQNALGEAIGINYVSSADKDVLIARLTEVDDQEYFEGGIEAAISLNGSRYAPVDISAYYAVEVDFAEDLVRANEQILVAAPPSK